MFTFKKESYTDQEITINLERKTGIELQYGIKKTYLFYIYLYNTKTIVGYIDLRLGESEYLYYMGNIGYHIFEQYRGNHYAAKALRLVLRKAKNDGINNLLITCSPDNIASYKTIIKYPFILKEKVDVPSWHELYRRNERVKCVFEIDLKENEF